MAKTSIGKPMMKNKKVFTELRPSTLALLVQPSHLSAYCILFIRASITKQSLPQPAASSQLQYDDCLICK